MAGLVAPRFFGEDVLESCLSGHRIFAGSGDPPETVRVLQKALADLGFAVEVDGAVSINSIGASCREKMGGHAAGVNPTIEPLPGAVFTLAAKRGGVDAQRVPAAELYAIQEPPDINVLALDAALSRLETVEPRWSRLVELRFFVGLSVEETAAAVGLSPATVKRDWSLARAWLYREIGAGGNTDSRDSDCASEDSAPVVPVKTDRVD